MNDAVLLCFLRISAMVAGAIVLLIFGFLLMEAGPVLSEGGLSRFFTDPDWQPTQEPRPSFNLLPMLVGSVVVTLGAVLISAPVGVGAALFLRHYAPQCLVAPFRRLLELLGGIPSVVFGLWGLTVLVPLIAAWQPPGTSLLAGILTLGLMILPTVALATDSALAGVPEGYQLAAAALGFSRWTTLRRIVLPVAMPGILTGVFLQTARALGETMVVLMVCGNVVHYPASLFAPVRTLTANIALEMSYALGLHRSALFAGGLLLTLLVVVLVWGAEMFRGHKASPRREDIGPQ